MIQRIIKTTFKLRRGHTEALREQNVLPSQGEPIFDIDLNKLKIGDGVKHYNELEYIGKSVITANSVEEFPVQGDSECLYVATDPEFIYRFDAISKTYVPLYADTLSNKVDKVEGKELSSNDFTDDYKSKLEGIQTGAEVNVQPDWAQNEDTADDYIKNKPTVDQTYSSTSENAQSGKAVAESIKDMPTNLVNGSSYGSLRTIRAKTMLGICAFAEGYDTTAKGDYSHAEGHTTTASGLDAHTEGTYTKASNYNSHAEGYNTTASGINSHSEGYLTTASGIQSHAEGNNTTASGNTSHTEGYNTTASGIVSHAEGSGTTASGNVSHAEGRETNASSNYQHVQGKCNIADTANIYADIIGNGSSDTNRSNAATVDWQGNAWYAGTIKLGGTSQEDESAKEVATKEDIIQSESNKPGLKTSDGGEIFSNYDGENANKALSEASSASGQGTKAGGKGFKITAATKIDDNTGTYTLNSVTGLEVGMEYSVKLIYARIKCGKILSISGTTVTVDGYPNIALSTKPETAYDKQNYLTIVKRPDLGDIDIGFFAVAFGENCIAQDRSGFVAGRDNVVLGQYGAALGRNNISGYCGLVSGKNNRAIGDNSTIFSGNGNTIVGSDSTILGSANSINGKQNNIILGTSNSINGKQTCYSTIIGCNNKIIDNASLYYGTLIGIELINNPVSAPHIILGQFNEPKDNIENIVTIGGGTSSTQRKNIVEITPKSVLINGDGHINKQGYSDTSIVQKKYVDNNFISKKVIEDNAKRAYVSFNDQTLYIGIADGTATPQSMALRTPTGTLRVATPADDNDAATKKYVDDAIATQVSSVYKAKGSIPTIADLPTPSKETEGFVYNIESEFTTNSNFVEGVGKTYPAGTNVVIVNTTGTTYKYDVLAGMVDLTNYATKTDLNNYYTKSQTYTKTEVDNKISATEEYIDTQIGDINTALDSIIEMQNSFIGGN